MAKVNKNFNPKPSKTFSPNIAPISIPTAQTNVTIEPIVSPFLNLTIKSPN